MALDQSVCTELLEAFKSTDGVDLIRDAVRYVFQELIEAEATSAIGADRYERNEGRVTERNGHRVRLVSTKAGDVELAIPKLRKGSFFPSILEPRRRIDQALYAVVMEAYVGGISTRSVDELVGALGASGPGSRSPRSAASARASTRWWGPFGPGRLDHQEFPYVFLDATYLHVRDNHHVTSKAVVIATGVRADGHREILGLDVGDSEDEVFWRGFLRSLADPGARRGEAGHLGPARRAGGGHRALLPGGGAPAVPGALRPEPLGQRPQGPSRDSGGCLSDGVRLCHPGGDLLAVGPRGCHASPHSSPRPPPSWREPRKKCWPSAPSPGPLAPDLVDQPLGAAQP